MLKFEYIEEDLNNKKSGDVQGKKELHFPYKITKVSPEVNKDLLKYFKGERTGFVQVGPKKWFFPSGYEKNACHYYNFETRPDDVWIVTYPRSGTTWTQEMVWLLANDLDYDKASRIPLTVRFPFLEFSSFVHKETKAEFLEENKYSRENCELIEEIAQPVWKFLSQQDERRFIKTHLPFSLLPPDLLNVGCKVIYVARNPKDVAVSFYHLNRLIRTQGYIGDFPKYWDCFEKNLQPWGPYWEHLKEGWSRRYEDNLLFLFYEDLNKNLKTGIEKVTKFLDKDYTKQQLDKLEDHLKIENFRNNKSVNNNILKNLGILIEGEEGFVRKGKNRGWQDYFTDELNDRANKWIEYNLAHTDLRFPNS